uniref:DNA/RNA-binding protein Kin17 WH-like domain-containing protein n=1 Tax=Pyxicephalus adspersus TaxID=30357 RepID=A0AAV3B707_PYXAD|nr:TPA: hypothetical protein GDO54_007258 [Pyxicephalus adspersus]
MGKADFLTPKAIANRIKSKGLQKLRWYCQMCQKQCRDENGFKCHCMSESHQRQLLLASENPQQFMDYFSDEFRTEFLELLRRRFGTKRVHNNIVYNEYISHREHVHMNATQWETLTDFTKWLGRAVVFNLGKTASTSGATSSKSSSLSANALKSTASSGAVKRKDPVQSQAKEKKKKSALDEIMEMEEQKKKTERTDFWLQPDIVVKIVTKRLGEKYYKKKAVVKEVVDRYTAIVKLDSGDKLKLDQTHLETVIPAPGKKVLVLNGGYKGTYGVLDSINEKSFSATIVVDSGPLKGRKVEGLPYEDFSKVA